MRTLWSDLDGVEPSHGPGLRNGGSASLVIREQTTRFVGPEPYAPGST
jgi:hypothetical protein